jgi:hypothetical protein
MFAEHWRWVLAYLLTPLVMIAVVRAYLYFKQGQNESRFKDESLLFYIGCAVLLTLFWPLIVTAVLLDEKFNVADRVAGWSDSPWQCKREHLTGSVEVQGAESIDKVIDPLHRVPDIPFGHLNAAWLAFLAQRKFGYRLHSFAIPDKSGVAMRGYAWVRLGTVKAEFIHEWGG